MLAALLQQCSEATWRQGEPNTKEETDTSPAPHPAWWHGVASHPSCLRVLLAWPCSKGGCKGVASDSLVAVDQLDHFDSSLSSGTPEELVEPAGLT